MNVLITGSNGFIGRNLVVCLEQQADVRVYQFDVDNTWQELEAALAVADLVYHLAGVNRPESEDEFQTGNVDFTTEL